MPSRSSIVLRNLPNVLTTLRLAAVPVFIVIIIYSDGPTLLAGLIFLGAAFTDFLDGFLARRFRVMSQYGKILDPLADRLLVNSAVLLLCWYDSVWLHDDGRLLGIEFAIVIVRDAFAALGYARLRSRAIPDVSQLGKWGMALMMAGLAWLLLLPEARWPVAPFELGLAASVVALLLYKRRYARELAGAGPPPAELPTARID